MTKDKRPEIEDELDMDFAEAEVDSSPSSVAASAKKNFIILVIAVILIIVAVYYVIFGGTDNNIKKKEKLPEISSKAPIVKPVPSSSNDLSISIPSLPALPPLEAPKPPEPVVKKNSEHIVAPPQIVPNVAVPVIVNNNVNDQYRAAMEARKKSSIMQSGGNRNADKSKDDSVSKNNNAYFALSPTSASQQKATKIGKMSSIIAQGKIIDAIVETALNTDLAGTLRAIVTRDVYAEAGKNILIPKGSRLIGSYSSTIKPGQDRVSIIWTRLIRPDGIDLMIDSPGVDKLGRTGVEGVLDNKYLETFGNAILLSSVNIGFAVAADKLTNAQAQTTTSVNTGTGAVTTSQTGTTTDSAVQQGVSDLQNSSKQIVQNSLQITPTITIDQGTIVKVFVNKDLIFPADMVLGSTRFIE